MDIGKMSFSDLIEKLDDFSYQEGKLMAMKKFDEYDETMKLRAMVKGEILARLERLDEDTSKLLELIRRRNV